MAGAIPPPTHKSAAGMAEIAVSLPVSMQPIPADIMPHTTASTPVRAKTPVTAAEAQRATLVTVTAIHQQTQPHVDGMAETAVNLPV